MTDSAPDPAELPRRIGATAPFVAYRGPRRWEDQHPARPLVWALVWTVVPAFWAGSIYWLAQAVFWPLGLAWEILA